MVRLNPEFSEWAHFEAIMNKYIPDPAKASKAATECDDFLKDYFTWAKAQALVLQQEAAAPEPSHAENPTGTTGLFGRA